MIPQARSHLFYIRRVIWQSNKLYYCVFIYNIFYYLGLFSLSGPLVGVWYLIQGVLIKEMDMGVFLFQFSHECDIQRVIKLGIYGYENLSLSILPWAWYPKGVKVRVVVIWQPPYFSSSERRKAPKLDVVLHSPLMGASATSFSWWVLGLWCKEQLKLS